jgi:molybdopterin-guanine dinucleotide biosynthesis protein A
MGEDKACLQFGDAPTLAQYQYDRLIKIFDRVYMSTKDGSQFDGFGGMIIEDNIAKEIYAPTAGFVNIFKQLKADDSIFVLSVDTPFVTKEIIDKLLAVPSNDVDAIIVRTPEGIHPLCGIYRRSLEGPILEMIQNDDHKLGKLLKKSKVYYLDIDDEDALMNINTKEEYERALVKLESIS